MSVAVACDVAGCAVTAVVNVTHAGHQSPIPEGWHSVSFLERVSAGAFEEASRAMGLPGLPGALAHYGEQIASAGYLSIRREVHVCPAHPMPTFTPVRLPQGNQVSPAPPSWVKEMLAQETSARSTLVAVPIGADGADFSRTDDVGNGDDGGGSAA